MKKKIFTVLGALLIICVPTITALAGTYTGHFTYKNKDSGKGVLTSFQLAICTDRAGAVTTSTNENINYCTTFLTAMSRDGKILKYASNQAYAHSEVLDMAQNAITLG